MPGHSKAVAVTYPEILCDINTINYSVQLESNNVWCVGREENYEMLDDIISELCELFPSDIFHIGADEVNMDSWRQCPRCQALMKRMKMNDVIELQNYFVRQMEAILAKHGKNMGGWDEIIVVIISIVFGIFTLFADSQYTSNDDRRFLVVVYFWVFATCSGALLIVAPFILLYDFAKYLFYVFSI